jgi:Sec-independent protein secretion pathway component TatC
VRFLQLSPGEFFFTTLKVAGYSGLLIAAPTVLYEVAAYVVPGLTKAERRFLAPIIFGSSILFYLGLLFSYEILTPAALNFFVSYAEGAVESLWSIDQYFSFVLVLMLSTGLSFQVRARAGRGLGGVCVVVWCVGVCGVRRVVGAGVRQGCARPAGGAPAPDDTPAAAPLRPLPAQVPVVQVMLGQLGIVTSEQMFSIWRYVVVGATVAAAVLTPSTDPFTQTLLAVPLVGLYFGGAAAVRAIEQSRKAVPS